MDKNIIMFRCSLIELKVIKKDNTIEKIGQIESSGIVDFYDYPFESKIISCACSECKSEIAFEIYEGGGVLNGFGASMKVKSSWLYGLTKSDLIYLADFLQLSIKNVNDEKGYLVQIVNSKMYTSYSCFKNCEKCGGGFILSFTPLENVYREIALDFYIKSIFKVDINDHFKRKYII